MYETIPVRRLDWWLERGFDGRIIDLREPEDFYRSHLLFAENYPYEELMENPAQLTKELPLLFYCSRFGSESLLVCNYFYKRGYEVYNLGGGFRYYQGKYRAED